MKRIAIQIIFLCPFIFSVSALAQRINYGVLAGGNLNFVSVRSDYDIQNIQKFNPLLSFNTGVFLRTSNTPINFLASAEYARTANSFDQRLSDYQGNPLNVSSSMINHALVLNGLVSYKIIDKFYLGTGVSGSLLLKSTLKVNQDVFVSEIGQKFTNISYRTFTLSVPFLIGYDFHKFTFFSRFNLGLMNRLCGDTYVKEINHTWIIGVGYIFKEQK